jgi:TolA-binding protein
MQLDVKDILFILGIISSLGISILSARAQFMRVPSQNDSDDASAVRSYAEAAERISKQNQSMAAEVEHLRTQVDEFRKELEKRDAIIQQMKIERDNLKNWAERLVYQLKSHELVPVLFYDGVKEPNK